MVLFRKSLDEAVETIAAFIMRVVSDIPDSPYKKSKTPDERARKLVADAALQSAALSGTLALPPGPLGVLTILPDLYGIWRVQARLVADIAAVYGREGGLNEEAMIHCLFKHVASQVVRDVTMRIGERALTREATIRVIDRAAVLIGGRISERVVRKSVLNWLPIVGAVGVAGYAYYDTSQVGKTALDLFGSDSAISNDSGPAGSRLV